MVRVAALLHTCCAFSSDSSSLRCGSCLCVAVTHHSSVTALFDMVGAAAMLGFLDAVAAARDLAQLQQHNEQAAQILDWIQHLAAAVAEGDRRPAMEVGCMAALVLQARAASFPSVSPSGMPVCFNVCCNLCCQFRTSSTTTTSSSEPAGRCRELCSCCYSHNSRSRSSGRRSPS